MTEGHSYFGLQGKVIMGDDLVGVTTCRWPDVRHWLTRLSLVGVITPTNGRLFFFKGEDFISEKLTEHVHLLKITQQKKRSYM
jgi:hypothetical protein